MDIVDNFWYVYIYICTRMWMFGNVKWYCCISMNYCSCTRSLSTGQCSAQVESRWSRMDLALGPAKVRNIAQQESRVTIVQLFFSDHFMWTPTYFKMFRHISVELLVTLVSSVTRGPWAYEFQKAYWVWAVTLASTMCVPLKPEAFSTTCLSSLVYCLEGGQTD